MKTIGIDMGTTTISAVLMDLEKKQVLDTQTIPNDCFISGREKWERLQDPDRLVRKVVGLLDQLLKKYPEVVGIGLTGQMHGIVYTDQNGKAVSPLYTWQDGSGDQKEWQGMSLVEEISQTYGIRAASGYGLMTHLYHHRKHAVPVNARKLATIGDYLGMHLTNRTTPLMHAGNAASLGFYDCQKFSFREDLLQKLGIEVSILPTVTKNAEILGEYQGRPVITAIGDNQASYLGAVQGNHSAWLLNMGTGGQLSVYSEQYFETEGLEARPYLGDSYLLVGALLCAGRGYAILEKFFRSIAVSFGGSDEPVYDWMEQMIKQAQNYAGGMKAETTFQGTRWNPEKRGSFLQINENNFTPGNMILAVLNGIADEYYEFYEKIHEGTGLSVEQLVVSGNGIRKNPAMQEIIRERFKVPLKFGKYLEEAAAGAAFLPKMT